MIDKLNICLVFPFGISFLDDERSEWWIGMEKLQQYTGANVF
jgi:hypothetical protein